MKVPPGGAVETMGLTPIDWRSRLTAKHIFTHVEWHMTGYALTVRGSGRRNWNGWIRRDWRSALCRRPLPGIMKRQMIF